MDVMGSAAAGGDETGRVDEDDESKTGTGTQKGLGREYVLSHHVICVISHLLCIWLV